MTGLVTFNDIRNSATTKLAGARSEKAKAGWQRLLGVVDTLDTGSLGSGTDIAELPWQLQTLTVSGVRGIGAQELTIKFTPTPGVTVFIGENGSGKSSICEALRLSLDQRPDPDNRGRGGNLMVWEGDAWNAVCSDTRIAATLCTSTGDRLELTVKRSGEDVAFKTAFQPKGGEECHADPSLSWYSLVKGSRPVYSFADWDRRVRKASELGDYLESMLILGDCFEALYESIDDQKKAHQATLDEFRASRQDLLRAAEGLDLDLPNEPTARVDEPGLQALATGATLNPAGRFDQETATLRSHRLSVALDGMTAQDAQAWALTDALRQVLHTSQDASRQQCPICRTEIDWYAILTATLERQETNASRVQEAILCANDVFDTYLELGPLPEDSPQALTATMLWLAELRADLEKHGVRSPSVFARLQELEHRLSDPEIADAVERVQSERLRASAVAHRAASEAARFIAAHSAAARSDEDFKALTAARRNLDTLRSEFVAQRTQLLRDSTADRVTSLLGASGITVDGLHLQKTKGNVALRDRQGQAMELSMLSAGQRNALILAPALATASRSPFGFVVLDDPVHAFDDIRIDKLATLIAELATTKRVIVFTHDTRLLEHIGVTQIEGYESYAITRTAHGIMEIEQRDSVWEVLIKDARNLFVLADRARAVTDAVTNSARGLLRQALDNAMRTLVLRGTAGMGTTDSLLAELDSLHRTKERLAWLQRKFPESGANTAEAIVDSYLPHWNRAMHGNLPTTPVTRDEIDAARTACQALA